MVTKLYYVTVCKGVCSTQCNTVEYLLTTGELVMAIGSTRAFDDQDNSVAVIDKNKQEVSFGFLHRGKK